MSKTDFQIAKDRLLKTLNGIVESDRMMEIARKAIEDELIEYRDMRLAEIRGNGLVIREKDGTDSHIIRFGPETAMVIGLKAIIKGIEECEEPGELNGKS